MKSPLLEAIQANDLAAVQAVLDADPAAAHGASPEGTSFVCLAVYRGQQAIAAAIAAAKRELDVFEAAALGRLDTLSALLDANPDLATAVADDGFYPLGLAAYFKHPDAVRLLLDRGADPNQAAANAAKVTALHAAVSANQPEVVAWLLEAGADVNARQQIDYTPLMGAAANARDELLEMLLEAGADPSMKTTDGKTAADLAREHGHGGIADRLKRLAEAGSGPH